MTRGCLFLSVAALKLQTRVKHWEYSNDDPSYWLWRNIGPDGASSQETHQ